MNAHSYETYRILRGIRGFEEIALWAACHHEEPDGSGYPFHLVADATPLPARILRVADIFQAMVQERPYRQGMDDSAVARFMAELVAAGRCEARLVDALLADLPEARRRASGRSASRASTSRASQRPAATSSAMK
ncbi:HD domain-containing phosphohydrolase, partial [Thauera aminoaromatica]|uniref:HD-GYP domain-containing protein n=1 Tax=Thauera aminoaromatica TaxID=164330 RepID=UPI003211D6D2